MSRDNPYVIEIDYGRNCYSCGGFDHITKIVEIKECRMRKKTRV